MTSPQHLPTENLILLQSVWETQLNRHEHWKILKHSLKLNSKKILKIEDPHHLQIYNSGNTKLHPLLVKFLRLFDAIDVLSN